MYHAPWVNAIDGPKTVIIEKGFEALYPDCDFIYMRNRRDDAARRARPEFDLEEVWKNRLEEVSSEYLKTPFPLDRARPRKYFIPRPYGPVSDAQQYDVVICPRKRAYGANKNWPHWPILAEKLQLNGLSIFAAGHPESSYEIKDCPTAWGMRGDFLDETIQAFLHSRVVVATDAGLAHLALMCGRPLIMITHKNGLVAPGEDDVGNDYWPVHMHRYHEENHTDASIVQVWNGWGSEIPAFQETINFLNQA
jgi:ADP-heptose:LPS heptosyltransferase